MTQTARELVAKIRAAFDRQDTVAGDEAELAARVERLLADHHETKHGLCDACEYEGYPCPVVRTLDGEEQ